MSKIQVQDYTFDASAQTITFNDYGSISLENILLIANVTDNVIIYQFNDNTKGGTVATSVLTLTFDTTSMSDTDSLQIFYWDDARKPVATGQAPMVDSLPVTIASNQSAVLVQDTSADSSLAIIDDWDESDRAKVNLIVGQAGVQGGSGTVSATTQRVVLATDVALPAGTNAIGKLSANSGVDIGDVDVTSVSGNVTVVQGTAANLNVTEASAANSLTALQLIDDTIFADDAGFTVGTHKVSMAGHVAVAHGSNPDAADANDAVARITNRHRVPFSIGGHPNTITVKHTTITTAVTDAAIITVSSGTKIVVTAITATLDNASTVFPTLLVGFGAANTPTTTGVIMSHGGVPAGGGVSRGDGSGIIGIGADGEDLRVTTTGNATGNGLQIVVTYHTIES